MTQYELHATFATPGNVQDLINWVERDYGYKLHRIENFCRDGTSIPELIGSYEDKWDTYDDATASLDGFVRSATETGWTFTRKKIETVPWHANIIQDQPPELYWESHTKAKVADLDEAWRLGFHVSKVGDGPWHHLTRRSNSMTRADFELDLQLQLHYLMNSGVLIGSTHVEYCLLDTNPNADDKWLTA